MEVNFAPPSNARDIVIYAVGGGGAGGQMSDEFIQSLDYKSAEGDFDTRLGKHFAYKVIQYTTKLGSQTQAKVVVDMPKWFDWGTISGAGFESAAVACGGAGGAGGTFTWHEQCKFPCMKRAFCRVQTGPSHFDVCCNRSEGMYVRSREC